MSAVIYSRIGDDPRGLAAGVDRQTEECRALAAARGVDVLEVIEDNDISASSGKRHPGFQRVLELIEARIVDTVVIWHTDRLYRLPRDLEPLIALADVRKLHKAERQRSASDQRAARGVTTVRPGYDFRRDGDRLMTEPHEAEVLREAARRVLAGESLRGVAADFNARGVPSPSAVQADRQRAASKEPKLTVKTWNGTGLRRALQRPSLAGLRVHRGAIIGEAQGDAILDRDTWDRLIALLTDPTRAPGKVGRGPQHLLSGIATCGLCGGVMYRQPGWQPKPDSKTRHAVSPAYACASCNRIRRAQQPVDEFVTEVLLQRLERPDATAAFTRRDDSAWAEARDSIDAIDARLANAADSLAEGDIDRQQLARITATLRTKRDALEAELRRAMPPAVPVTAVGALAREAWARLDLEQQRALARAVIDVTILPARAGKRKFDPDTVQITARLP